MINDWYLNANVVSSLCNIRRLSVFVALFTFALAIFCGRELTAKVAILLLVDNLCFLSMKE